MRRAAEVKMTKELQSLSLKLDSVPVGFGLIGLSGGADSVALLHMLAGRADVLRIEAIHINHGIRGKESDEDEEYVRSLCSLKQIKLHVCHPDLNGCKDENSARKARLSCFRECLEKTGADFLILAHQQDDLAETFIIRLLRGAGPSGLECIVPDTMIDGIRIIRPMLNISRQEIRNALKSDGIPWREDSSNKDQKYLRNAVRSRLIPLMEDLIPGASARIAATARLIADENDILENETRLFLQKYSGKRWIDGNAVREEKPGMQRRILRQWWQDNAPYMEEHALNYEQTERLIELAEANTGKINLPGGFHACKGKQAIHLTGFSPETIPCISVTGNSYRIGDVMLDIRASEGEPGNGKTIQEMPEGLLRECVIRTRLDGDRIIPFGMKNSRKLQDFLTDRGIDEPWRDRIPLLCRGREVIFAAGVGAGNIPRWEPSQNNVRLCWSGELPWYDLQLKGATEYGKNS